MYKNCDILLMASLSKPHLHQDILIRCLCVITTTLVSNNNVEIQHNFDSFVFVTQQSSFRVTDSLAPHKSLTTYNYLYATHFWRIIWEDLVLHVVGRGCVHTGSIIHPTSLDERWSAVMFFRLHNRTWTSCSHSEPVSPRKWWLGHAHTTCFTLKLLNATSEFCYSAATQQHLPDEDSTVQIVNVRADFLCTRVMTSLCKPISACSLSFIKIPFISQSKIV